MKYRRSCISSVVRAYFLSLLGAHLVDQSDGPLDLHGRCGLTRSLLGTREEETQDERADDEDERSEIADAPSHRTPAPGASVACTAIRFAENAAG